MYKVALVFFLNIMLNANRSAAQLALYVREDTVQKSLSLKVLPQNFYTQHLSFFCKKEVQLQKLTSLPLFIRAGSKAYVDYLEKKPAAGWLPRQ